MTANERAGLAARRLAVLVLTDILNARTPLDDAFETRLSEDRFSNVEARDRAFARAIVAVTLRRKGQLAAIIKHFIEKPLPEKRGRLDAILLCSAAQLVFLKNPPHAVINLAVHQVREDRNARRFAKLANAVLRRISEQGAALEAKQDAVRLNTAGWLWDAWTDIYGVADAGRIAAQHLIEPPLDLTVKSAPERWADRLGGVVLPTGSVRLPGRGRIEDLDGFADGQWWVQDVAASLPARLMGDVEGLQIADLCAAPGGKTAQLVHAGAHVTAVDASKSRLERLKSNLARLELGADIVHADLLSWEPGEQFDAILLDAPCSATGTIRRHPDLPYLKSRADLAPLLTMQRAMLGKAIDLLKPGGFLVYATCSLEAAEGPDHIDRLLTEKSGIALSEITPDEVDGRAEWLQKGRLRTFPYYLQLSDPDLGGMDGFFAARLIKPHP